MKKSMVNTLFGIFRLILTKHPKRRKAMQWIENDDDASKNIKPKMKSWMMAWREFNPSNLSKVWWCRLFRVVPFVLDISQVQDHQQPQQLPQQAPTSSSTALASCLAVLAGSSASKCSRFDRIFHILGQFQCNVEWRWLFAKLHAAHCCLTPHPPQSP